MGLLRFIFFWYWAFCLALLGRRDDVFTLFQAVVRLPHPGSTFPGGRYRAVAPPVVGVRSDPPDSTAIGRGGGGGGATPHSRSGCGRESARPKIWAGSLLGGSQVGAQVLPSRRDTLGGGGGGEAPYKSVYNCT